MRCWPLWLALSLCACGAAQTRERSDDPVSARWHYDLFLDDALERMSGRVCFEGRPPRELRAGKDEAASHLIYARWASPGPKERLAVRRGRVQLERDDPGACIDYAVRLRDHRAMGSAVRHHEGDLIASPNVWLWRPQRRAQDAEATLRLRLPDGLRASLPWRRRGDAYSLDADAFRFDSYAAFGKLRAISVEHAGVTIDAAVLRGELPLTDAAITRWLERAIDVTSTLNGRFPTQHAQIIIAPSGPSPDPVQFGAVARGGSGSILLFVSSTASESALVRDWVLPHELSHLCLPFVKRDDAWLPEGLATYYQEVLRARAGVIGERETLESLAGALESASREGTGRPLGQESAAMYETHAFRAVYWGGAAYFLMADVALRERTEGSRSLDWLVTALTQHPPEKDVLTADELLAHMDALLGLDVMRPLARRILDENFPPFRETLSRLGVREQDGRVALDDDAELSGIRRAIFSVRTAPLPTTRAPSPVSTRAPSPVSTRAPSR